MATKNITKILDEKSRYITWQYRDTFRSQTKNMHRILYDDELVDYEWSQTRFVSHASPNYLRARVLIVRSSCGNRVTLHYYIG